MTVPTNTEPSFVFYLSFDEMIAHIPDEATQLQAYGLICQYALHGIEPQTDNSYLKIIFCAVKPLIDANNKRRANGKKGGRKPAQPAPEAAADSQQASMNPTAVVSEKPAEAATTPQATAACQQASMNPSAVVSEKPAEAATTPQATAACQQASMNPSAVVSEEPAASSSQQAAPSTEAKTRTTAGAANDNLLGPADRIVYFGENQYPTTPSELGRFEKFAYKLFERYHDGGKPNLADIERVMERTYTRIVRPDGEAIAAFDMYKGDLLDYAFEQAKAADKLNWKYLDGMYRNFLVRGIETGAEARQYDLERAKRMI